MDPFSRNLRLQDSLYSLFLPALVWQSHTPSHAPQTLHPWPRRRYGHALVETLHGGLVLVGGAFTGDGEGLEPLGSWLSCSSCLFPVESLVILTPAFCRYQATDCVWIRRVSTRPRRGGNAKRRCGRSALLSGDARAVRCLGLRWHVGCQGELLMACDSMAELDYVEVASLLSSCAISGSEKGHAAYQEEARRLEVKAAADLVASPHSLCDVQV
eukprot:2457073-Rhodomonas_salina.1